MIELVNVTKTYKAKKTKDTLGLDNVSFKKFFLLIGKIF